MAFEHGGAIFSAAISAGCKPDEILDFSASINPLGLSAHVRKACHDAIELSVHYPAPYPSDLSDAIASKHGISPDSVVPANGSTSLIHLIPTIIKGDSAIIVAPAFSEYSNALARHGWKTAYHTLKAEESFRLDTESLGNRLMEEKPSILFFCNPGNPSGKLYSREDIEQILLLCESSGTLLVLDEAFMDFCGEENSSKLISQKSGNCILLRSMTKFYALAGLRLGFAIAAPDIAAKLREAIPPWDVNTIAQHAGIAALSESSYEAETISLIKTERAYLEESIKGIRGMKFFYSSANYLLIQIERPLTSDLLQRKLFQRHRILIRDCSNFKGLDSRFIRVAVRGRQENMRLIDGLREEGI